MNRNFIDAAVDKLDIKPAQLAEATKEYLKSRPDVWLADEEKIHQIAEAHIMALKFIEKYLRQDLK